MIPILKGGPPSKNYYINSLYDFVAGRKKTKSTPTLAKKKGRLEQIAIISKACRQNFETRKESCATGFRQTIGPLTRDPESSKGEQTK